MQCISIVVPVYNEVSVIDCFYDRLKDVLKTLNDFECEVIFVDDGSEDASYRKLTSLSKLDKRVRVIKFSRNFGHQIAITAGIDYAEGDSVVVIDVDLQDPPEVIKTFVEKW